MDAIRSHSAWRRTATIIGWRPPRFRPHGPLSWLLVAPCVIRVSVQLPLYLAGTSGAYDPEAAVAALGVSKIVMGWPLQIAALAAMVWLLARNHTPVDPEQGEPTLT